MQRGFGGTVFEPVQPERRDRELTLGPFTLTLIGCGLFALCGLCFVFGYAVGHRNADSSPVIALPPPGTSPLTQPASLQSKPSAGQTGSPPQEPVEPADSTVPTDAAGTSAPMPSSSPAVTSAEPVHAVLSSQSAAAQPASGSVQSALAQPSGIMVQIAAVAHPEDADVLVGALRKRGYAVTARRDPTDGLLHVQIGPFPNRTDASAMRQKLLNDGYNAIVQP